jgi:hypothetical protein
MFSREIGANLASISSADEIDPMRINQPVAKLARTSCSILNSGLFVGAQ